MQITMSGIRGSGKTCYLYATFNAMFWGYNSLIFNPVDTLKYQEYFDIWDDMIKNKQFPPGTANSQNYDFSFILAGKCLGFFTWYDYRGAILQEKNNESEYRDFESRCMNSDCVVFAIPADLIKAVLNNQTSYLDGAGNVMRDLGIYQSSVLNLRIKKPSIPIVINVTKGDLLSGSEMMQAFDNIIKTRLSLLFGSQGGDVLVCRTSIQKTLPDGSREFIARNVHQPIVFPFYLEQEKAASYKNGNALYELLKGSLFYRNGKQVW